MIVIIENLQAFIQKIRFPTTIILSFLDFKIQGLIQLIL
jgi:hypothetical protein